MSGLAAGFCYGALVTDSLLMRGALGATAFLFAYLPDLDHLRSTVTRLVPVLGPLLSRLLRATSRAVYSATKGPRDEDCAGDHRHLSHTLAFALVIGGGMAGAVAWVATWEGLTRTDAVHLGLLVGGAAALGCLVHCLGDALTLSGCPLLWPIPICGETWYELRPPRLLRFRAGGVVETRFVAPLLVLAVALSFPGVWPLVSPLLLDAGHGAVEALRS